MDKQETNANFDVLSGTVLTTAKYALRDICTLSQWG